MTGGALRRLVTFKSKQEFLPSNAPYWTVSANLVY